MAQARLLDIAIREFGSKGLEGASTRGIAAAAGTAMSSITYHFGGKEGLYLAAADHIVATMAAAMGPLLAAEAGVADGDAPGARAAVHRMLGGFTDHMMGAAHADWSLFIVREQMEPTAAFDRLFAGPLGRMAEQLVELICTATGRPDRQRSRIAALMLIGQVVVLRASRALALRLLDVATLDRCAADIRAQLATNIDAILDRMGDEPQEPQ